ncbi:50S ribosomal protein L11 methyltransferase [Candidatus Falkowbacteria bacterium]|nr:50S ribosomal protein L11 methyltransferase [Candidatus Falkowbacteria bacterium]
MSIASISAAPYVPLFKRDVRRMLEIAQVNSNDIVYDLGSGDGRMLVMAARKFEASECVGFEISFLPYLISKIKILLLGHNKKIKVIPKNLYTQNLKQATVITCFLLPHALKKLGPKFATELKPGTRIVSYAFRIPGLKRLKKDKPNPKSTAIHLYVV